MQFCALRPLASRCVASESASRLLRDTLASHSFLIALLSLPSCSLSSYSLSPPFPLPHSFLHLSYSLSPPLSPPFPLLFSFLLTPLLTLSPLSYSHSFLHLSYSLSPPSPILIPSYTSPIPFPPLPNPFPPLLFSFLLTPLLFPFPPFCRTDIQKQFPRTCPQKKQDFQ